MEVEVGDLWVYHNRGWPVVIPTNLGIALGNRNPMGRGVALQAAERYPGLPELYGRYTGPMGVSTPVVVLEPEPGRYLFMFPTKPLDERNPHLSWRKKARYPLVEKSARELSMWEKPPFDVLFKRYMIALPLVGCGEGGLDPNRVMGILHQYLGSRFCLVLQE